MARYTGPDCRQCRREGGKLFLKGTKCYTTKCTFEKRVTPPGQHGAGRKKVTEYGTQLREKQKVKKIYGLLEKQFRGYYDEADRLKGETGKNMLQLLERRLDNVVYRMNVGSSRSQSRQLVNHGHITVNGNRVTIPSYIISAGDVISVKKGKEKKPFFKDFKDRPHVTVPKWLEFDRTKLNGKIIALPEREDIDMDIREQLIVELYSK